MTVICFTLAASGCASTATNTPPPEIAQAEQAVASLDSAADSACPDQASLIHASAALVSGDFQLGMLGLATDEMKHLADLSESCRREKEVITKTNCSSGGTNNGLGSRATAVKPVTIAGYPLGGPFTMPQCTKSSGMTNSPKHGACWTLINPLDPERRQVWWGAEGSPIGLETFVTVRDCTLMHIGFGTAGIDAQDHVLSQLREKFGSPSSFQRTPVQNMLGARFEKYEAKWQNKDVYVEFRGMIDRVDRGSVNIETAAEHTYDLENRKAYQKTVPKL